MEVKSLKYIRNAFDIIVKSKGKTDKIILYYDNTNKCIMPGYCYAEYYDSPRGPIKMEVPYDVATNLTEANLNLYVNKLKEKIKLIKLKEDF